MLEKYGVRFEDDPLVFGLLNLSVQCVRSSTGSVEASVLDLMGLRTLGWASPPFDYEVTHLSNEGHDYVLVRERIKNRDGSDFQGAPGFVRRTYYYDDARGRFDLVDTTPENDGFDGEVLQALSDPLAFLLLHRDAVCNGRGRLARVAE